MDSHTWLIILRAVIWTNTGFFPKLNWTFFLIAFWALKIQGQPATSVEMRAHVNQPKQLMPLYSFCTENSALEAFSPGEWEKIKEVIIRRNGISSGLILPVSQDAVGQIPYFIFTLGLNCFSLLYPSRKLYSSLRSWHCFFFISFFVPIMNHPSFLPQGVFLFQKMDGTLGFLSLLML